MVKGRRMISDCLIQSKISLNQRIECLSDKGYQGIQKLHANSQVPKKKPRKGQLADLEKPKVEILSLSQESFFIPVFGSTATRAPNSSQFALNVVLHS